MTDSGSHEMAGGQVVDLLGRDLGIEDKVELFQGLEFLEVCLGQAQGQAALLTAGDLVFEEQFQEL